MGIAVMVVMGLLLCALLTFMAVVTYDHDSFERDVREGRFMSDLEFRGRWRWVAAGPLSIGGFASRRFPGVVCALTDCELDGCGRPRSASECVVVVSDDASRTCRDLLDGRLDGEPYAPGAAMVSITRRMGDGMVLAQRLAATYGAKEVLVVRGRSVGRMAVTGEHLPTGVSEARVHDARGRGVVLELRPGCSARRDRHVACL